MKIEPLDDDLKAVLKKLKDGGTDYVLMLFPRSGAQGEVLTSQPPHDSFPVALDLLKQIQKQLPPRRKPQ